MSPSNHGGSRPGAGRPSGEPTRRMRVPESQVPAVQAWLEAARAPVALAPPRALVAEPSVLALGAFLNRVPAGSPALLEAAADESVDLNRHLVLAGHEGRTVLIRVSGWSMIGAGIFDQDEVLVDRALEPRQGDIVVALVNGELTIKRLGRVEGQVALLPENPHFKPILLREDERLEIWGVVTRCLRKLR